MSSRAPFRPQFVLRPFQRFARVTRRTIGAAHCYYDARRQRWVIFRRAARIERRTSIRGPRRANEKRARSLARALSIWPGDFLFAWEWPEA